MCTRGVFLPCMHLDSCNHSSVGWTTWQPHVNPFKATYHPHDGCVLWRYDLRSGWRAQGISCLLDKAEACTAVFIWAPSGSLYLLWAHTSQAELSQARRLFSLHSCCHFLRFPIMQSCCISHLRTIASSLTSLWRAEALDSTHWGQTLF